MGRTKEKENSSETAPTLKKSNHSSSGGSLRVWVREKLFWGCIFKKDEVVEK